MYPFLFIPFVVGVWLSICAADLATTGGAKATGAPIPSLAHMCEKVRQGSLREVYLNSICFPGKKAKDMALKLSDDIRQMLLDQQESLDQQLAAALEPQTKERGLGANNFDVIMQLLEWGANPSCRTLEGHTALHRAARHNRTDLVDEIVKYGCVLDATDVYEDTPAHLACRAGHLEMVKKLLEAGAQLEMQNNSGDTPLHVAAWEDKSACVTALVTQGASVYVKNSAGRTPLNLAYENGFTESVKILQLYTKDNQ